MKVRLLTYNIKYGGRGRESAIAAVIKAVDPDIVMLQEATDRAVVAHLAERTGLPHWDSRPKYSTGYLTRLPVAEHNWTRPRGSRHAFLEVAITSPTVRVFGLHLSAYFSNWSERRRAVEIKALLHAIREHQDGAHLIAGDFNALSPGELLQVRHMPRWIRAMVWLSGRDIARHTIQHMLDQRYIDAWRANNARDDGFTFPTWNPHVRLDYVFAPERYQQIVLACRVVREPAEAVSASDHFPVLAELDLAEA